jgi:hypothetical protein
LQLFGVFEVGTEETHARGRIKNGTERKKEGSKAQDKRQSASIWYLANIMGFISISEEPSAYKRNA